MPLVVKMLNVTVHLNTIMYIPFTAQLPVQSYHNDQQHPKAHEQAYLAVILAVMTFTFPQ